MTHDRRRASRAASRTWRKHAAITCVIAFAIAAVSGCGGHGGVAQLPSSSLALDVPELAAASREALDGFAFLPPLGDSQTDAGPLNTAAEPVVEVYEGTVAAKGALITRIETPDIAIQGNHFQANWNTGASMGGLPDGIDTCVIEVRWEGTLLGSAGCSVGASAKDKDGSGGFGFQRGRTIPIKFAVAPSVAPGHSVSGRVSVPGLDTSTLFVLSAAGGRRALFADGAYQIETPQDADQIVFLVDASGEPYGMVVATPSTVRVQQANGLDDHAITGSSTAVAALMLTPGLLDGTNIEACLQGAEQAPSVPALAAGLEECLAGGDDVAAALQRPDVSASFNAALLELRGALEPASTNASHQWASIDPSTHSGLSAKVTDDSDPSSLQVRIYNAHKRYVAVYAGDEQNQQSEFLDYVSGPSSLISFSSGMAVLNMVFADASLYESTSGSTTARYNSERHGTRLTIYGLGFAAGSDCTPSELRQHGGGAIGLTCWHYLVVPTFSLVMGVRGDSLCINRVGTTIVNDIRSATQFTLVLDSMMAGDVRGGIGSLFGLVLGRIWDHVDDLLLCLPEQSLGAAASLVPYVKVAAAINTITDYGRFAAALVYAKPKESFELIADDLEWVWVPPGEFMMGADDLVPKCKPIHRVRITKGFYLSKYEVTNAQYRAFCAATGRTFPSLSTQGDDHPVVKVSWHDAKAYCDHYGLRLPTEAEWEYAARGTEGRNYPWGNTWDASKCVNSQNRGPTRPYTMPVGSIPPGDSWCGASDMAGNVWEWCADWWDDDYYDVSPVDDPTGPATGHSRLVRGGSWDYHDNSWRSAYRLVYDPGYPYHWNGFRCARTQ